MIALASFSRALAAATLMVRLGSAQQCFYPNGSPSTDTPCGSSGVSSCCASSDFCMDNGLCFGSGLVSRGSCTDQTWASDACTKYCKTAHEGSSIPIMPCSNDGGSAAFVCGIDGASCQNSSSQFQMAGSSFVLRPSQVEALVGPALSRMAAQEATLYTAGQMAALGCGLGLPLLFGICFAAFMWQQKRTARPKLMYKLPDDAPETPKDLGQFRPNAPPPLTVKTTMKTTSPALRPPSFGSYRGSVHEAKATQPGTPMYMQNYVERYQATMGDKVAKSVTLNAQPIEIGAGHTPPWKPDLPSPPPPPPPPPPPIPWQSPQRQEFPNGRVAQIDLRLPSTRWG